MSIKRLVTLVVCAVLIFLCVYQVQKTPPLLQYVIAAPEETASTQKTQENIPMAAESLLKRLSEMEEGWNGILSAYAVTVDCEQAMLQSSDGRTAIAHLRGEYGSINALPERILSAGRDFYPEEKENGDPVIILDEQLAIAVFRVGDPVGRSLVIGERSYRVIGVARGRRAAGERDEYCAYVPLLSLYGTTMETLTVWGRGVSGAGAFSKFKSDMHQFAERGNLFSLQKERERALLPVWLLLTILGVLGLLQCWRAFGRFSMRLRNDYQERLQHCFAVKMIPRLLLYITMTALTLGATLLLSYLWAKLLLHPVAVFPEWIPATPVEIDDILQTYWQNVRDTCTAVEYRSAEVLTLRMWRMLLRPLCVFSGALLVHTFGIGRGKAKNMR